MSHCRILAVSEGYLHKLICFWTALNHSSSDLSPCLKLVSKSNRALTSFDCGLQKSSNLVHNVFKVSSQSVKPHDTTKSIPSSPDHDMSFLHCLVSDRVASSQSKMFSHFSFHFRNRWYKPSLTVQSILGPSMYGTNCCSCVWRLVGWTSVDTDCSLCEADWSSCLREFRVVILYYFCGALDNLVSGQNPHSIHLLESLSCLCCLRRVEPSTGLLQNFSAVSVDLCTVVRKQWLVCVVLRSEGYQLQWAWIPPGQGERQHEVCTTNLTLFPRWSTRKGYPVKAYPSTSDIMFYPCVCVCVYRIRKLCNS